MLDPKQNKRTPINIIKRLNICSVCRMDSQGTVTGQIVHTYLNVQYTFLAK